MSLKKRNTTALLIELHDTPTPMQHSQNLPIETLRGKSKRQKKQKHKFFSKSAKRREKETEILTTHKAFIKTHFVQQTKHQLRHDINGKMVFELQGMEPLIDEYKLQVDFNNFRYKLTALSNIIFFNP